MLYYLLNNNKMCSISRRLVLCQSNFRATKAIGSITLLKYIDSKELYINIRIGDKKNAITIPLSDFIKVTTELETSMKFTDGPLTFDSSDGAHSTHFVRDYEIFKWSHSYNSDEIEVVKSPNGDLYPLLMATSEVLSYFRNPSDIRDTYESN
jgi:hypothetical protein